MKATFLDAISPGDLAVVTGGASGIGLAAAKAFAARDMRVYILDRASPALEAAGETVTGSTTYAVDVSDAAAMKLVAEKIEDEWGEIAVLMNNAGIGDGGDVFDDLSVWNSVLGINLLGVLHGVQAFVPAMIRSGHPGLVINTGSKQGITQPPGNTAYNVSKAGVKALTEGLAHTLREKTGGLVSAHLLIPGFTHTGMTGVVSQEALSKSWSPEQVVSFMLEGLGRGDFYILCPDGETTPEMDHRRIAWAAGDMIQNRPALSRWHPDYTEQFAEYMRQSG